MVKVSIIVPNFNHARYLSKRFDSIFNQTYCDYELIILDDCSTDNSKNIIELYKNNPKVRHVEFNTVNSGSTFYQWKKGISLAAGEYIWIAESDDWAEPEFLEKSYRKFQEDNEIGLVYSNSNLIVNDLTTNTLSDLKIDLLNNKKWASDYIKEGKDEILDSLVLCCSINNASAVLFKKEILLKACPFHLDFKYLGDWYCYLKIASISKIAYINQTLNNYRDHADNVSKKASNYFNQIQEYFLIYNWIFKTLEIENKIQVMSFFYGYTKHSFTLLKYSLINEYVKLYRINKKLLFKMIWFHISGNINLFLKGFKKKTAC